MAALVGISGPGAGQRYPLERRCVLGRAPDSDIVIGDLNVSRRHAEIRATERGEHVIQDMGSGNGTFVNDEPVAGMRALAPRDVIRIGGSSFRFEPSRRRQQWADDVLTVVASEDMLVGLSPGTGPAAPALSGQATGPPAPVAAERPLDQLTQQDQDREAIEGLTDSRAVTMLESMFAVADEIAAELDLSTLLHKILDHLLEVFPQAERGFVLLVNPSTGQLVPEAVRQRSSGKGKFPAGLPFSRTMVSQVMASSQGVIRDVAGRGLRPGQGGGDAPAAGPKMGAPLFCRGESLGTVHLEGRPGSYPFSADDLSLLSAIARQAAVAIASARAVQALGDQKRLEADLELARKIQLSFLPERLPEVRGLRFETHYVPALDVGGDFFDVIQLDEACISLVAGDISGKGVSAALMMAKLATEFRVLSRTHRRPAEVMTRANETMLEAGQDNLFATVVYILLDMEAGTFTVTNAGHQPPMVVSPRFEGIAELDDATATALGVIPGLEYPEQVYKLVPDDVVMLYTDGINEAMNRHGQEYGMERLRGVVGVKPTDPAALVQRLLADLQRFVGGAPQSDDQTVVAFGLSR